jgi:DNA-binding transcriptional regulator YdaS (Cro superfamily)
MTLRDYFSLRKTNPYQFSKLIGSSPATVHRWVTGDKMPSAPYLAKIEELTRGRVKPRDFLGSQQKQGGTAA